MQAQSRVDDAVLNQLRALGGQALLQRLVSLFFESSKGYVAEIGQGIGDSDLEKVEKAAHTLKSGAGSLGARAVFNLAETIESAARNQEFHRLPTLFDELSVAYRETCTELASALEAGSS